LRHEYLTKEQSNFFLLSTFYSRIFFSFYFIFICAEEQQIEEKNYFFIEPRRESARAVALAQKADEKSEKENKFVSREEI
jgi:hypothetical protein